MSFARRRPFWVLPLICALGLPCTAAQRYVERRYDPPVGSRWSVLTVFQRNESVNGKPEVLDYTIRSDLTFESKVENGYRITYVNRDMQVSGNSSNASLLKAVAAVLKGITVRALTDTSGKPVRVENIDAIHPAIKQTIDIAIAASGDSRQNLDIFRRMLSNILLVNETQGAAIYLNEIPTLALGQNTGLKVGEERRSVEEGPSPLGGAPMRSNQVLKLVAADGGKARYAWTDAYDPESLRNLIAEGARQIAQKEGRNGEDAAARTQALLKSIKITRDEHTDIDIENGTIRRIQSEKNTVAEGLGITYLKRETKTVTVTRLP